MTQHPQKSALRSLVRSMKQQYSTEQLQTMSESVIRKLLAHPTVVAAKTIMMYYSLPDEVNTRDAIDELVKRGKTLLLPVVTGEGEMELRLYHSQEDLHEGAFHIMEPIGPLFTDYATIDVAIVPGMAFDTRGNRLGRGKGYYDRFLPRLSKTYKIGICFPFQKLPGIPTEPTDIRMDELI